MAVVSCHALSNVRESRKESTGINSVDDSKCFIWTLILYFTVDTKP